MTTDPTPACLSSETLGAFAEGRLATEERDAVIAHLDSCARCREEVALLADFVDADAAAPARRRPAWWAAAAAAIVVAIAAIALWRSVPGRDARPIAPLIAASAELDHRIVEPRLHGFAWAAYRGPVRASDDDRSPERLRVLGAAGDVLKDARDHPTADAEHAAGVASLLIADPASAIARLRAAAERSQEASAWSDLAAAHYELGARLGRASQYADALAAADRALKSDAHLSEALFNRALILERLGLIDDARAAWKRYLEVDGTSSWAAEARRRLDALPVATNPSSAFQKALETADPATLVARFPQQARAFAEVELLARWAEHNDDASLAKARAIGAALQKRAGESLLADAVRAIDDADIATRARLAEAHLAYRNGRLALHRHDAQTARRMLVRAASLFGETPAAWNARYFAAVAEHDAGRTAVGGEELHELANALQNRTQFRALRAQTAWQRGLVHATQARWPDALEQYQEARDLFANLGETSNAAFLDLLIGEAATMLGRRDEAWGGWTRAFRALSEHGFHDRLVVTLGMISNTESIAGRNETASSILDLELAHATNGDRVRADALFRRAIISARLHDLEAARRAVDEGTRIASRIDDADVRANLRLAEGIVFERLSSLSDAIEHYRAARPLLLPVACANAAACCARPARSTKRRTTCAPRSMRSSCIAARSSGARCVRRPSTASRESTSRSWKCFSSAVALPRRSRLRIARRRTRFMAPPPRAPSRRSNPSNAPSATTR
jgi:tetratricopeptide (TPR) repeat protein